MDRCKFQFNNISKKLLDMISKYFLHLPLNIAFFLFCQSAKNVSFYFYYIWQVNSQFHQLISHTLYYKSGTYIPLIFFINFSVQSQIIFFKLEPIKYQTFMIYSWTEGVVHQEQKVEVIAKGDNSKQFYHFQEKRSQCIGFFILENTLCNFFGIKECDIVVTSLSV